MCGCSEEVSAEAERTEGEEGVRNAEEPWVIEENVRKAPEDVPDKWDVEEVPEEEPEEEIDDVPEIVLSPITANVEQAEQKPEPETEPEPEPDGTEYVYVCYKCI